LVYFTVRHGSILKWPKYIARGKINKVSGIEAKIRKYQTYHRTHKNRLTCAVACDGAPYCTLDELAIVLRVAMG